MSAPYIEDGGSAYATIGLVVGVPMTPFQVYAWNMPAEGITPAASWSSADLPAGLAIRNATVYWANEARDVIAGEIYGTPTTAGYPVSELTATNDVGTDTTDIQFSISAAPVGAPATGTLWDDLEIDFDLGTRAVTLPGVSDPEDGIVFRCAKGDRFNLLVGLKKYGVLQDVKPASETVTIRLAVKEYEEERVITLASGTPAKVGSADGARWRVGFYLDPSEWALLADYEADRATGRGFPAQMEVAVDGSTYERFCSDTFLVGITRDQIED